MRHAVCTIPRALFGATLGCFFCAGCIPFWGSKPGPARAPSTVVRFADQAAALGLAPSEPTLPEVTRALGRAVDALPANTQGAGAQIAREAQGMEKEGGQSEFEHARRSLDLALVALGKVKRPAGSSAERRRAIGEAQQAIAAIGADGAKPAEVGRAYRAVGEALLLVTGGSGQIATGRKLAPLVARFAVEEADAARRTGAQLLYAMADAFDALPGRSAKVERLATQLRAQAQGLSQAATLAYSSQLQAALSTAATALAALKKAGPALAILQAEARAAVGRVSAERPFELERPAVQDAVRLLTDGLTVAGAR
ncbi:MAG TPA: hypothetical protein VII38_18655 [Polyangia bacterium]